MNKSLENIGKAVQPSSIRAYFQWWEEAGVDILPGFLFDKQQIEVKLRSSYQQIPNKGTSPVIDPQQYANNIKENQNYNEGNDGNINQGASNASSPSLSHHPKPNNSQVKPPTDRYNKSIQSKKTSQNFSSLSPNKEMAFDKGTFSFSSLPTSWEDYATWTKDKENLAEAALLEKHFTPTGPQYAKLMIIVEAATKPPNQKNMKPDGEKNYNDNSNDKVADPPPPSHRLFNEQEARLFLDIIHSLNLSSNDIFYAPLIYGTLLDETIRLAALPHDFQIYLRMRALHLANLIQAKHIIIMGDGPSRLLMGEPLLKVRGNERNINHNQRDMTALATFHPRSLFNRTASKKALWFDILHKFRDN